MLSIEKTAHAAKGANFKTGIPDAGMVTSPRTTGCDCAYMGPEGNRKSQNGVDALYGYNPDIRVYTSWNRSIRALFRFDMKPRH